MEKLTPFQTIELNNKIKSINGFTFDIDSLFNEIGKKSLLKENIEINKKTMLLTATGITNNNERKETILDIIKKNDILPINEMKIHYSYDKWDFSNELYINIEKNHFIYDFSSINEDYKEIVKDEILIYLLENKYKFASIKKKYSAMKVFTKYLQENYTVSLNDFHYSDLEGFLNYMKENLASSSKRIIWRFLYDFMKHYNIYKENLFDEEYFKIMKKNKPNPSVNKFPNIPENYFNNFLISTLKTIDDVDAPKDIRGLAGIYLILSQTGLRISELYLLNVDCLKYEDNVPYVIYKTYKEVKGETNYRQGKTFANDLTIKAIKFLQKLYEKEREELKWDLLYVAYNVTKRQFKNVVPNQDRIENQQKRYFIYLNKYFQTVYTEPQNIQNLYCVKHHNWKDNHLYIVKPKNHQFRVHVINSLYERGVPLEYIKKYMNHLTSESTAHYLREKEPSQKEMEEIERLIRGLANGDVRTINNVKEFQNNLDKLKKFDPNNIKVITNEDELYEILKEQMTFTPKTGGFCVKPNAFTECAYDKKTNEFYCAYDVCGNLMKVFYHIDLTYYKIDQLLTTIEINEERGRVKEVQKQKNKLLTMINDLFVPQLNELKRVIDDRGKEYVAEKYPETIKYIDRIDELERNIEEWKNIAMS